MADKEGRIFDHPLEAAVRAGQEDLRLPDEDWIPLPEGSTLFALPGRRPVVWETGKGFRTANAFMVNRQRRRLRAVAVFLPAGYTRTHLPAARPSHRSRPLPLWAYTAIGWREGTGNGHGHGLYAAAVRTDVRDIHNPLLYNDADLLPRVRERVAGHPDNRLIRQLVRCATVYHCFAAKNFFLRRWECPLPTAPSCNAQCAGCLSAQPACLTLPSHGRLAFSPTVEEVVQVALPHLEQVEEGIVSFGQGCEGEPLLQADLLEAVIRRLRSRTDRGTINLNTNGSLPRAVVRLARAGLDAVRVSLNATDPARYAAYYEPRHYTFRAVLETIRVAQAEGLS
ncbi:MAG: radical SAM protein, partial [Nitrospirae bacterium]|nr:radical SAM protein [Nitrospirota bacterium]